MSTLMDSQGFTFETLDGPLAQANIKASEYVDLAIHLPDKIRTFWNKLRRLAEQGEVEAVRAVKGAFLHCLEQFLAIARDAQQLAQTAAVLGGKPLPGADQLNAVISDLESLRREALVDWQYPPPDSLAQTSLAPVWMDEHCDIYAGRSGVRLDTIIEEFNAGTSPEDIVSAYDTLQLAEVNAVISYYLRYRDAVDAYLRRRETEAEELRQKVEAAQPSQAELKAQIKERWSKRKAANASPAE